MGDYFLEQPTHRASRFNETQMMTDARRLIDYYNGLVSDYSAGKKNFACGQFTAFAEKLRDYRNSWNRQKVYARR